jgi:putative ABC transport system permease protein
MAAPPMLNRVFLRKGRLPRPDDRREVVLGEAFADANGLQPGDSLVAVINGRRETLDLRHRPLAGVRLRGACR